MKNVRCKKCGEFNFFFKTEHSCKCKEFTIIDEDEEEHKIFAIDEYAAALKYAEDSNVDCDYYLMNASVDIMVNNKEFTISAEPDVHYSAKLKQ